MVNPLANIFRTPCFHDVSPPGHDHVGQILSTAGKRLDVLETRLEPPRSVQFRRDLDVGQVGESELAFSWYGSSQRRSWRGRPQRDAQPCFSPDLKQFATSNSHSISSPPRPTKPVSDT